LLAWAAPWAQFHGMNRALVPAAEAGFSLVELMVALAIAGLAATAVILSLPATTATPAIAAQRLAVRLAAARDMAVIAGRPVAVTLDAAGYAFALRRDGAWVDPADRRLRRQAWPAGVALAPSAGQGSAQHLVFDVMGMANAPLSITLSAGNGAAVVHVARDGAVAVGGAKP